jgi:hypothetical protein
MVDGTEVAVVAGVVRVVGVAGAVVIAADGVAGIEATPGVGVPAKPTAPAALVVTLNVMPADRVLEAVDRATRLGRTASARSSDRTGRTCSSERCATERATCCGDGDVVAVGDEVVDAVTAEIADTALSDAGLAGAPGDGARSAVALAGVSPSARRPIIAVGGATEPTAAARVALGAPAAGSGSPIERMRRFESCAVRTARSGRFGRSIRRPGGGIDPTPETEAGAEAVFVRGTSFTRVARTAGAGASSAGGSAARSVPAAAT